MSDVFVTSDEHYGHERIIEYTHRPFKSVEEQTETIIAKHNAKVPNNSNVTTIHVGDMFWHTLSVLDAAIIVSGAGRDQAVTSCAEEVSAKANIRNKNPAFIFVVPSCNDRLKIVAFVLIIL